MYKKRIHFDFNSVEFWKLELIREKESNLPNFTCHIVIQNQKLPTNFENWIYKTKNNCETMTK